MSWEFELVAGPYSTATDGPVWDGSGVLFTQVGDQKIWRYDPWSGNTIEFRRYTSRTTRLAFSADGILYGAQSGSRRIVKFNPDGSTNQLMDRIDGKYHNHPFDLAVDSQGRIWFSDPYSVIPTRGPQIYPTLDYAAVLRQERPAPGSRDWVIRRLTRDTANPGAVLLSQDEGTLYLMERNPLNVEEGKRELRAYPVQSDGTLGTSRVLQTFGYDARGVHRAVSGMCLDQEGNIVACAGWERSGPGPTVMVISPEGRVLESHPAPVDQPTNCCFGGADLGVLYVTTAGGHLYRANDTGRKGWALYPGA
ncbi:MAG: SMP-30/gluconolactonase/LRE family protein [Dehalococcoidia bacterium]